ncbi:MAG TPA: DUF4245 family protein [Microbacterium sp.]|uniref:DUF4245 family protein n=1 Tax=Microbacterium sp. TaxID=51671 RepID=UPI002B49B90D|nr:DUF4245 family protein [Microbacterium sp.]HKT57429.1 DUF4245 family protein [Microbacterium sp.]
MASHPRIVAELGRPETPEETADRKAEASRVYRSSQTFRNLIAALIATLAIVFVVTAMVPRGDIAQNAKIDVAAQAQQVASGYGTKPVVPVVPSSWRVNAANVSGDKVATWTITYVPGTQGFLNVAQGFGADTTWDARLLNSAPSDGTVTIDGIVWTRYEIGDPAQAGNVSYALATAAGRDRIMVYGATDPDTAATAARALADQIRSLRAGAS